MKTYLIIGLISFCVSVVLGKLYIPFAKRYLGQPILSYVKSHKSKNGTPTMGGLFFIISASIVFLVFGERSRISTVALSIGLSFMFVGFIDDFIKIKYKDNQGLKPYQKLLFQLSISLIAGFFCYYNKLTVFYLPFKKGVVDLGFYTVPLVFFIFIAITNSVNLTDGLDGLSASSCAVYLIFITLLIGIELNEFSNYYLLENEYRDLELLSVCLIGAIFGFLVYNTVKASVFMGDTGSLSLGGFIGIISILSSNGLFIPIIGITFVWSSVSVLLQVCHFKRTGKRVFLMAPFHHHLQLKGYSESKISYIYSVITCIFGIISVIFYL